MLIHDQLKIYRVRLPMPFELNHINCYAIKGATGWSLVDCGLNNEECILGWQNFMKDKDIKPQDISGIYLTHSHPDHDGLAAWFQQLSEAPVYMSAPEAKTQEQFRIASNTSLFSEVLLKNGIPSALISKMDAYMDPGRISEKEMPYLSIIEPEEKVMLGDFEYSVIVTPGHTGGHTCFYNQDFGILISGDNILPEISPNIGLWPWTDPNPLNDYLESLELCRNLHCKLVLPAHGEIFSHLTERISVLKEIHKEKLDLIKSYVTKETTVYKIVLQIYGKALDMINLGLAMGEVYAHLMFLCYRGELQLSQKDGQCFFSQ